MSAMRTPILLVLAMCGGALAQGIPPRGDGTTPGGTPAAATALDPDMGWYRLTYQRQPVGFAREEWKEEQYNGKTCFHVIAEGQFVARPDLLRDLPYTDFKITAICDIQTLDLQWASFALSFPVQVAPGAGSSDFKLVQGFVRFAVDRRTEDGRNYLRFTSSDEEFQDAQLALAPGDEFIFPDAVPRMLAGRLRVGPGLEKRTILLTPGLASGHDAAKYVANLSVRVVEEKTVKISEEDVKVNPVLVTITGPEGIPATKVYLMDAKGIVRKAWTTYLEPSKISEFAEDPQDTIVATRVASELEAREGLAFVLSAKGRRDPFVDPRTPATKSEKNVKNLAPGAGTKPLDPGVTTAMSFEEAQELVREAERLRADVEKIINLGDKASPAQQADRNKFESLIYEINGKIQGTKFLALKAQMTDLVQQLEKLTNVGREHYLIEARAIAKRIEEIFKNDDLAPPIRVSEIEQQVEKLKSIKLNPALRAPDQAEVDDLLKKGNQFHRRAKIIADFEVKKPDIRGVVVAFESVTTPLRLGIVLFTRPVVIETEIPLPRSKSAVILSVKGSKSGHHTYEEGQTIEGPDNIKVKQIERNRVWFEYEQETIPVPTPR